ncbi:hypothetical protein [Oricola sp.]|uniref:hypothetical protein n=1 Tax=Oricola sp. TaxID=1979950 RepID=UPI0025F5BF45|nr:hypothetical protein [Oricola sp.]MCI5076809.1 hypothetical protein [Oricola sp.]
MPPVSEDDLRARIVVALKQLPKTTLKQLLDRNWVRAEEAQKDVARTVMRYLSGFSIERKPATREELGASHWDGLTEEQKRDALAKRQR